jgi:repressor LexA
MNKKSQLTPRQNEILQLIVACIDEYGFPPTRAEIAQKLGFASANAAEEHLRALVRKGVIELLPGTSRGIRLKKNNSAGFESSVSEQSLSSRFGLGNSFGSSRPGGLALTLPLIGRVSAGSPILAQEHIEQNYYVEEGLFSRKPDYLLKVRGMSMRDAGILDGDLLAVQSTHEARDGQIVVARIGEDVTVKRIRKHSGFIELHPENPEFSVIIVKPKEVFSIEGVAVGLIRNQVF